MWLLLINVEMWFPLKNLIVILKNRKIYLEIKKRKIASRWLYQVFDLLSFKSGNAFIQIKFILFFEGNLVMYRETCLFYIFHNKNGTRQSFISMGSGILPDLRLWKQVALCLGSTFSPLRLMHCNSVWTSSLEHTTVTFPTFNLHDVYVKQ